ncbi:MAG: calcium-binding protein [Chloroflexota bacterium]
MKRALTTALGIVVLSVTLAAPVAVGHSPAVVWDQVLVGTAGADTLKGGDGRDKIRGLASGDDLAGGKGADLVKGGPGNDTIKGGGFRDKLYGGNGADILRGGPGADALYGGKGKDILKGGSGNDVLRAAGDAASDFVDCGTGTGDVAYVDARDVVTRCERVIVVGQ